MKLSVDYGVRACYLLTVTFLVHAIALSASGEDTMRPVALQSKVDRVQPMTGVVFWTTNEKVETDAIQLEYRYVSYDEVVTGRDEYDWTAIDRTLEEVAGHGHQAVLRMHYVYPGQKTKVPGWLKSLDEYKETNARSEGKPTSFPDWSDERLQEFTLDFYSRFAERYDNDPRLAFLQTGFGLWAEYHIYSGPRKIGRTFPSKEFQQKFFEHLTKTFKVTPWMISVDAADGDYSPFEQQADLLELKFGLFDDSFLCKQHAKENAPNWRFFGKDRWQRSPAGGEFSYYTNRDQKQALAETGPHGIPFAEMAARFHLTFIIGDGQPQHQSLDRIRDAGMACGYRFRVTEFACSESRAVVKIKNEGIATIYFDAWPAVNGVRSTESLKQLQPGDSKEFSIAVGGNQPTLTIESDRLVPGQQIQYDADLAR